MRLAAKPSLLRWACDRSGRSATSVTRRFPQLQDFAGASTFIQQVDHLVVAHALTHGHTMVTHKKPEHSRRIVKIPNPCVTPGVRYMTPYQMLRHEQARFVLGAPAHG